MWTNWPHSETLPVTIPYLDLEPVQGDHLSSVILSCRQLSDYVWTKDEELDEREKPVGEPVNVVAKQGTADKPLPCMP